MSIIKIENLSKKYIIGHDKAATGAYRYKSLRDSLAHTCRGIVQRLRHPLSTNTETTEIEEFWALKDINLEIEQGDKVGIIGRNGAGKSTLLKILSRITEPTTGKITINGRVASLLEVGTGFHPELTGRENIYLNGAVLGMTRKEIKKKFDEIVDFSGVEKFLDTPVKRFSSGMYVRLAFAVAAHLDPEILLIDEVLAVGDAEFQKKCLGKMDEVSKQGRTILFVSHNMAAIKSLCTKGILFGNGHLIKYGAIKDVIEFYVSSQKGADVVDLKERKDRIGTGDAQIVKAVMRNSKGDETKTIEMGEAFSVEVFYEGELKAAHVAVMIYNIMGDWILEANSFYSYKDVLNLNGKSFKCFFDKNFLVGGMYSISLCLGRFDENVDLVHQCFDFTVESKDVYGTGRIHDPRSGVVYADHYWEFK
ncbi:MAG TPA: hypothetical protein DD381_03585 [Lentisphaeria bacterium]|nr:MAG: hypothetical protein A2X47_09255 [Lentisphaerae bacterium GWF2_38_69]HBM15414.1 hypothetical protein [Lentisphaeria bacterium]